MNIQFRSCGNWQVQFHKFYYSEHRISKHSTISCLERFVFQFGCLCFSTEHTIFQYFDYLHKLLKVDKRTPLKWFSIKHHFCFIIFLTTKQYARLQGFLEYRLYLEFLVNFPLAMYALESFILYSVLEHGPGDDCVSIVGNSSRIKIRNIVCGPGHGIR